MTMQVGRHRVAITGLGLVTPVGSNVNEVWRNLCSGVSGIVHDKDQIFDGPFSPVVGRVGDTQPALDQLLDRKEQGRLDQFTQYALLAGDQALRDAGLTKEFPEQREHFGVYVGVGIGGLGTIQSAALSLQQRGIKGISPLVLPRAINNSAPSWLSMFFNLQGSSTAITNACSSGADAIGLAFRAIRDGYADYMVAGGAEACAIPLTTVAFGNMRALSRWQGDVKQSSRPFSLDRTGFVLAEGAGIMVLERYDLAQKRGATIYAELVGYGSTADAYHMTAMHPDGRGAASAIQQALADAQISPENVGYVNAHGTGTPMNDLVETQAIKKVFGDYAHPGTNRHLLVSSTKSMTGHMLGAAGGAEAIFAALSLVHQEVPPTINLDNPDPACNLDYVPHYARSCTMTYAMSNSFGFGGGNAVLVLKRKD